MRPSWMVQATVNEPLELLATFVAHHLELGADLVHLYLDNPHPEAEAAFKGHPKVRITNCDAAYWAHVRPVKGRPMGHPARQMVNYRHVYNNFQQDWLLLCDADEYLVSKRDIAEILSMQAPSVDYLFVQVVEKVVPFDLIPKTVFEGTFRTALPEDGPSASSVYGPLLTPMLERGVAAHDGGKSIVRRGLACDLKLHRPFPLKPEPGDPRPATTLRWKRMPDSYLAHYDALTPLHYFLKLLRKHIANEAMRQAGNEPGPRHPARIAQIALAAEACADARPEERTNQLHRLSPEAVAILTAAGLLIDLAIAPDQTARKHFPDLTLDYSPEAFDRALRLKYADTLAAKGIV